MFTVIVPLMVLAVVVAVVPLGLMSRREARRRTTGVPGRVARDAPAHDGFAGPHPLPGEDVEFRRSAAVRRGPRSWGRVGRDAPIHDRIERLTTRER